MNNSCGYLVIGVCMDVYFSFLLGMIPRSGVMFYFKLTKLLTEVALSIYILNSNV